MPWIYTIRNAKRAAIGLVGFSIVLFGVLLVFLPGPAFIVIPTGLAILATEFTWARKLLNRIKGLLSKSAPNA